MRKNVQEVLPMQKTIKLSSVQIDLPIELQHLRVAAYCRVSTEQEEQSSSIELQEQHYTRLGLV